MNELPVVPEIPPGTLLELRKEDWRYGRRRLRLRVERMRHDISRYYEREWVWIVGESLGADGTPQGRMEVLVRVAALPGPRRGGATASTDRRGSTNQRH